MNNKIKWKKLKHISENICGRKVEISGSTLVNGVKAAVMFDKDEVEILINFNVLKGLDEVIKGVSHELAHVCLNTQDDSKIKETWDKLYVEIKNSYFA